MTRHQNGNEVRVWAATIALSAALVAACARKQPPPPAPVAVEVVPVVQEDVPIVGAWIGTLEGSVNADIRPKVEGYVLRQLYKEGQFVRPDEPLFEIDPRQFRAALEQARGTLARSEAQWAKASKDVERFTPLAAQHAVSQQELDDALAAERDGRGGVAAARAALEQAALNVGWTTVRSPIEGIVGLARMQVGDLVSPQSVMTTVSTVDPIRVTIGISGREYLDRAASINRASYPTTEQGPSLELVLEDGTVFAEKGKAVFVDREIGVKTGTLIVKGVFPNPHNILRPGQYARVKAELGLRTGAMVVPLRAVSELQGGARVAVAGRDGKAEIRSVELGPRTADLWVVEKGLQLGESVIVSGLQYVRSGTPVTVKPAGTSASHPAEAKR